MDAFDRAEQANRPAAITAIESILKDGGTLRETPPEEKCRGDFELIGPNGKRIVLEHKARSYRSTAFSDGQLEGKKYDYLRSLPYKAYYINTFTDGVFAVGDLSRDYEKRLSAPHKRLAVVDSDYIQTVDRYLKLEEAVKTGCL